MASAGEAGWPQVRTHIRNRLKAEWNTGRELRRSGVPAKAWPKTVAASKPEDDAC